MYTIFGTCSWCPAQISWKSSRWQSEWGRYQVDMQLSEFRERRKLPKMAVGILQAKAGVMGCKPVRLQLPFWRFPDLTTSKSWKEILSRLLWLWLWKLKQELKRICGEDPEVFIPRRSWPQRRSVWFASDAWAGPASSFRWVNDFLRMRIKYRWTTPKRQLQFANKINK